LAVRLNGQLQCGSLLWVPPFLIAGRPSLATGVALRLGVYLVTP